MRIAGLLLIITIASVLASCAIEPEPINFGEDACVYCKMTIADPKFGAELVSEKGRVYKFDAIECMVPYIKENPNPGFKHVMAIAYDQPAILANVDSLFFVQNGNFKSPMGKNLAAFIDEPQEFESLDWKQLKDSIH